ITQPVQHAWEQKALVSVSIGGAVNPYPFSHYVQFSHIVCFLLDIMCIISARKPPWQGRILHISWFVGMLVR
ncbi:MAG: hypothetical protein JWO10_2209, partial [Microbacteriaceae bacterium]|nr:hypothetical protein [Microbacteriaceae bacterium]